MLSSLWDWLLWYNTGKSELFKGLGIDKKGYDWKKYPVVMLNMADVVAPTVDKRNIDEPLFEGLKG